jgi:REP element-mobilizing transposase RayT
VVFIPKYRKRSIYGWVRRELGPIIRDLAQQKESVVDEAHIREYIREQEKEDKRLDQLKIFE